MKHSVRPCTCSNGHYTSAVDPQVNAKPIAGATVYPARLCKALCGDILRFLELEPSTQSSSSSTFPVLPTPGSVMEVEEAEILPETLQQIETSMLSISGAGIVLLERANAKQVF